MSHKTTPDLPERPRRLSQMVGWWKNFVIEYHGAKANIFEIDSEGGTLKRLTAGPKFDGRPAYSPDGTKLAFQSKPRRQL